MKSYLELNRILKVTLDPDVAQIAHDLEEDLYTIICRYNYIYTVYNEWSDAYSCD